MSTLTYAQRAKKAQLLMERYPEGSPLRAALAEYILAVRDAEGAQARVAAEWTKYLRCFKPPAKEPTP